MSEENKIQRIESPSDIVREAIKSGADLDKLEKLLTLQERWDANQAKKAYHAAMAAFKLNPPKIDKNKKVSYLQVKYKHASLFNVVEKIGEALSEHGLSASWLVAQNGTTISVTCKITHVQGHSEETTLSALADSSGSKNSIQAIGSTITYLERYSLLAITGLAAADDDDDAMSATVEYIDDVQIKKISEHLTILNIDLPAFLKYMELESLEKMPKTMFRKAVVMIEEKRKAGKK